MSAWLNTTSGRVAFGALGIGVIVAAWTIVGAFRMDALPAASPTTVASLESIRHRVPRPATDIQSAVENDLFSPDRSSPGGSYRLPGEADPNEKVAEPVKPVVLGTVVATDGNNFAMVQMSGDLHPKLVHTGDTIGTWIVRAIERGKVTFVGTGGVRADVAAPKPGT